MMHNLYTGIENAIPASAGEDGVQDISILTYMSRRVEEVIHLFNQHNFLVAPLISHVTEAGGGFHRAVVYTRVPQIESDLYFVGFISGKTESISGNVTQNLTDIDRTLVMELAQQTGLLSYSSLQLADGNWCNLVIFTRQDAKEGILATQLHQRAAYELAPDYYRWIRLHHGSIAEGQFQRGLHLHYTKRYTFLPGIPRPDVQTQTYAPVVMQSTVSSA